jgi:hypothetical protein
MCRLFGSIMLVVVLSWARPAQAQMTLDEPSMPDASGYGEYTYGYQTYGGFGFGYSQEVPAGAAILDRFGIARGVRAVAPPYVSVTPRVRARDARGSAGLVAARPRIALPTGSQYWPGANGVILYSPEIRYRSYGDGYGRGPYGSIDHGIMYKGWLLNN